MMRIARLVLIIGLVLGGLTVLGLAIHGRVIEVQRARAEYATPKAPAPVSVAVAKPAPHAFTETVTLAGVVAPRARVSVFPKIPGRIEVLDVDVSATVKKDDRLALLDDAELKLRVSQAKAQQRATAAEVRRAQVQVRSIGVERKRAERLVTVHVLSKADLERIDATQRAAVASVGSARAQVGVADTGVELAEWQRTHRSVLSPIDGVITRRLVSVGAQASPAAPLFEIEDRSQLKVIAQAPARVMIRLTLGQKVTVSVDELPGRTFPGTVTTKSPTLDPRTRHGAVEITLTGDTTGLLTNTLAEVSIEFPGETLAAVPRAAVVVVGGSEALWVVRKSSAVLVRGPFGRRSESHVAVKDRLQPGDRVVTRGQDQLTADATVRIASERDEPHK